MKKIILYIVAWLLCFNISFGDMVVPQYQYTYKYESSYYIVIVVVTAVIVIVSAFALVKIYKQRKSVESQVANKVDVENIKDADDLNEANKEAKVEVNNTTEKSADDTANSNRSDIK